MSDTDTPSLTATYLALEIILNSPRALALSVKAL